VPRVKMDYFQNDLFPPSLVTWESVCGADEWFSGAEIHRKFLSLKPADMEPLYKDMYLLDVARNLSRPNTPNSATLKEIKFDHAYNNIEKNGVKTTELENGKSEIGCSNGVNHAAPVEKADTAIAFRKSSDGLVSWPPSGNELPASNNGQKSTMPLLQPKRLSIDPNGGTPLRDLLRRCDEIPGVIAMRKTADESVHSCFEANENDEEWK